jgi:uncharacterized protein HemX
MKSELNALKKEVEQLKIISDMDLATSSDKNLKKELLDSLSEFKKEFKKISQISLTHFYFEVCPPCRSTICISS